MVPDPAIPVRRFWDEVWSRGQGDVLHEIIAEGAFENGDRFDAAEFAEGVRQWREMFADFTATIEEILVIDDRVVSRVTYRGTHVKPWGSIPATGATFETIGIDIFRVRDGRIVELWHATDHLPVLQQIGGRVVAVQP